MIAATDPFVLAGRVRLLPGRDVAPRRRHPWIYRGALAGPLPAAGAVEVCDARGEPLGVALVAAGGGSLALRMVAWPGETWSAELLRRRFADAAALRDRLAIDSDAYRLVHAEGDGLPGLVIDCYRDVAVIEAFDACWLPYLESIVDHLRRPEGAAAQRARQGSFRHPEGAAAQRRRPKDPVAPESDPAALSPPSSGASGSFAAAASAASAQDDVILLRRGEGRRSNVEALRGSLPDSPIDIREGRVVMPVDLIGGHKTGFYLDQRDNRRRLGELAAGAELLNLFSYSGGFSVGALAGGARRAINVDSSAAALGLARRAYQSNAFPVADDDFIAGDAFQVARDLAAAERSFDVVVVDPPSFVHRKSELEGGLRGLKDINLQALKLVRPGGLLITCSCSALVDHEAFAGALAAAALDARRTVLVLELRGAAPDHPLALTCLETRHLQAWFCCVA